VNLCSCSEVISGSESIAGIGAEISQISNGIEFLAEAV
jgi:hypothetical protein